MVQYHKFSKSKKTGSGGLLRRTSDKKKHHFGGFFARPKLVKDEKDAKERRIALKKKGGVKKTAAEHVMFALVSKGGKAQKTRILNVLETPDNRHFARENVITLGAIIETAAGRAKVTSRPGQSGSVNAVLLAEKAEKAPDEPRKPQ